MKTKILCSLLSIATFALFFTSCKKHESPPSCGGPNDSTVTTQTIFATGLNNPRGLKFGPDGNLYVAEGGIGGSDTTTCVQVVPPVGPYYGSDTGSRISKIDWQGNRTTYVNHLPSSIAQAAAGAGISGVGDVSFIGNTMYAVLSGAGCSHGVPNVPNGVIKINSNGSWKLIANLSEFQMSHPVKNPNPGDFEPDGLWWDMVNFNGNLYSVEPNHGELDEITPEGKISRVIDISAAEGHIVPTALTVHNGNFYVGNLGVFPIVQGACNIYKITPGGSISVYASGFETILGTAFDNQDRLYVLEATAGQQFLTPNTGDIVRVDVDGSKHVIVSGLNFPTAMTFGQDGKLYVSNTGIGAPGTGQILKIGFKCEEVQGDNVKQ